MPPVPPNLDLVSLVLNAAYREDVALAPLPDTAFAQLQWAADRVVSSAIGLTASRSYMEAFLRYGLRVGIAAHLAFSLLGRPELRAKQRKQLGWWWWRRSCIAGAC